MRLHEVHRGCMGGAWGSAGGLHGGRTGSHEVHGIPLWGGALRGAWGSHGVAWSRMGFHHGVMYKRPGGDRMNQLVWHSKTNISKRFHLKSTQYTDFIMCALQTELEKLHE